MNDRCEPERRRGRAPLRQRPRGDGRATTSTRCSSAAPSTRASRARCATCRGSGSCTATPTCCCRSTATRSSSSRARRAGSATTATAWIDEPVFAEHPGAWIARPPARERGWQRLAVYGLDYVMAVRDYRALARGAVRDRRLRRRSSTRARGQERGGARARAREHARSTRRAFWAVHERLRAGHAREAELMAVAEEVLRAPGHAAARRWTWSCRGRTAPSTPEFRIPDPRSADRAPTTCCCTSLEIAGPGGHWVEFSRPLTRGQPERRHRAACSRPTSSTTRRRARRCRPARRAHDVHRAVSAPFRERGYPLGHVTGHSIGMTMIEHPKIGEGVDVELARGHGLLDAPARDHRGRAARACTCRTPGASARRRASRWRVSR